MRIAQLECELSIMESEFTRELDKLSKAESETATFWQGKHSRLQQQLAQAGTENQLLRAEVELREAESAELRAGWEEMQRAAVARDEEARSLREQVRGLKEWVSTSTRTGGQVASDEVFGDGMARLGNGLQNWVIVHFRRAKLGMCTNRALLQSERSMLSDLGGGKTPVVLVLPLCGGLAQSAEKMLPNKAPYPSSFALLLAPIRPPPSDNGFETDASLLLFSPNRH